ncbi:15781_t:CDS:2 [Funneliformis mosseae]|uniref:15781_t:CDS:1 n=1 Tax=Funneliformis mosseae TaxID=27381 RepID=A0A9N9CPI3_FUNMO|nr:15781_t:CDS:2 [Funneliformis mosseae]
MDIFEGKTKDSAGTSEEDQMIQLARLGRPLIYSYFDVKQKGSFSTQTSFTGLVSLLKIKLFGGASSFKDSEEMSSIAVLSVLVCLDISPQSKIASDLVASYMATCIAVSRDRELLVRYPSEPLLAEVALSAITDNETLVFVLQRFNEILKKGFVDAGPLKQLMELLDPAAVDNLQHFEDATRNNPGADIMIPVKLAKDRYSYILVQVKNYASSDRNADKSYPESGLSKLTSQFGQLREVPPIRKSKRQKLKEQQHPFAHFGLNFFKFLDPSVKEELADLLDAFISPFNKA